MYSLRGREEMGGFDFGETSLVVSSLFLLLVVIVSGSALRTSSWLISIPGCWVGLRPMSSKRALALSFSIWAFV